MGLSARSASANDKDRITMDNLQKQRKEMLNRKRRVILNNDGCDVLYFPSDKQITPDNLLALRTKALAGTQVDTLFYCTISAGFGCFTHNTKEGIVLDWDVPGQFGKDAVNATGPLIKQGKDSLQIMVDFCRANHMEIFWSMRMNDTHDGAHRPDAPYPLFSPIKTQHPEYTLGAYDNRPKYGRWSGVDYSRPEIRDYAYRFIEEVCRNYDVDGIEMDFFRHLNYFKSVANGGMATREELAAMTDLVRRVRKMTEREGLRRGRPILVAVRVPDSVAYCKASGLDIERWLSEGLVDMLSATCYFRLNPWQDLVKLGHRYGVKVYPCLSESRVKGEVAPFRRMSQESYRARATQVWQSGADGVYLFNFFNPNAPMLREIGDPKTLARLDKTYFATVRTTFAAPNAWLAGGEKYINIPILSPQDPLIVRQGHAEKIELLVGDDLDAVSKAGTNPEATCHILTSDEQRVCLSLNGVELKERSAKGEWLDFPIPDKLLRRGNNQLELTCEANDGVGDEKTSGHQTTVRDLALTVRLR